jgi:Putative Actinobacterial Holin-X, holin superfamily III
MTETTSISLDNSDGLAVDEQSLGQLVATASRDLSLLVHKEFELVKAELAEDAKRAGIGAGFLGGGGFLAVFGLAFLSVATAYGLSALGTGLGWGFFIVAVVYLGTAGGLAFAGVKNVTKVGPPRRTINTVKDDLAWAKHPRRDAGHAR